MSGHSPLYGMTVADVESLDEDMMSGTAYGIVHPLLEDGAAYNEIIHAVSAICTKHEIPPAFGTVLLGYAAGEIIAAAGEESDFGPEDFEKTRAFQRRVIQSAVALGVNADRKDQTT